MSCQVPNIYSVIYKRFFFINAYPTPVSECLQGLYSCTHACMVWGTKEHIAVIVWVQVVAVRLAAAPNHDGVNALFDESLAIIMAGHSNKHSRRRHGSRELLVFFAYTKLLVRTETRTRERKCFQSIWTVWDINRRKGRINFVMVGRTNPSDSDNLNGDGGGWVCAHVFACVRVCCVMCLQYLTQADNDNN